MNDDIGSNIIFTDNAELTSYGNMLASGEMIFKGRGNTVNVTGTGGSYDLKFKQSLFGNEFLFKEDEVISQLIYLTQGLC